MAESVLNFDSPVPTGRRRGEGNAWDAAVRQFAASGRRSAEVDWRALTASPYSARQQAYTSTKRLFPDGPIKARSQAEAGNIRLWFINEEEETDG
jgi:hypothetical protein